MAWRIRTINTQGDHSGLDCVDENTYPATVIMENTETGEVTAQEICWWRPQGRHCDNLRNLATSGFTPNDWSDECPPI